MTLNQLIKQSTETVTEYIAFVDFKGQEIPFNVTHTTRICNQGTSFTSVYCRPILTRDGLPNLTKGQKMKIRDMISKELHNVVNQRELLFAFIKEIKDEFKDENWDYLDFIAERFLSK